jgi:hypothetical protein
MTNDWTKKNLLPLADLEFWYQYEEGVSANNFINESAVRYIELHGNASVHHRFE